VVRIAVIPVGGEAVRLRPLTVETSKAMVRFLNRPLVELSILHLAQQGVEEFYFGVRGYHNYRDVYDYFREGSWFAVKYDRKIRISTCLGLRRAATRRLFWPRLSTTT
jgi:Nucleoside-diphosphate-sugar pyrophosphorylase involved in lipopolysaccharide biosynthesis/translation initiation factor 2B, gamma/epsilon subunits (eIF-2Bgamma/eIF-2Bepsilon)